MPIRLSDKFTSAPKALINTTNPLRITTKHLMFLFLELNVNQKNPQNKIFFKLNGRRKLPFAHFKDKEPSLVHLLDWTDCF